MNFELMGLVRRVGLGGDVEIISNIPPLTHTPMHQLADFLSKRGTRFYYSRHELQARASRGLSEKFCFVEAVRKVLFKLLKTAFFFKILFYIF